jgi:seryl-tRNA synthetase
MSTAAKVFNILRSLLRLFARKQRKSSSRSETTVDVTMTAATQGNEKRNAGFDMQTELGKLAERIVEPVAAKLSTQELGNVVSQIKQTLEQLNTERAEADTDFQDMALTILSPIQPTLSEAEFTRMMDRLGGAMAGFCQTDWPHRSPQIRYAAGV